MKKSVGWLVAVAVAAQVSAAEAPSVDRLVDCSAIAGAQERLACFDREVAPFAALVGGRPRSGSSAVQTAPPRPLTTSPTPVAPATAGPVVQPPAPAAPPAPVSAASASFGQEQLAAERRPAPSQEERTMHARLTSQRAVGKGMFNLYLDNGQVWRHEDQVQGEYLRDGEAVTIERAALGSYKLSRDAGKSRNWIRVTRIR